MPFFSVTKKLPGNESGVTLLETLVALAILGLVAVALLSGLTTAARATIIADEQATAESLARSQMEYVKTLNYVYDTTEYPPAPILSAQDYLNYSATIAVASLRNPDDGIQKITVTVKRAEEEVIKLEGYKVDR